SALGKDRAVSDARLAYFKLLASSDRLDSPEVLYPDYVRVARFLYNQETTARGTASRVAEAARLYQRRPYSSDSGIEAACAVYLGLGALHELDPDLRVRRVLIVGPGMDLAPRTNLNDLVSPQSYQPFAVADAVLTLALASERDLRIQSLDVNERVLSMLQRPGQNAVILHLFTRIPDTPEQPLSPEYGSYARLLRPAIS